VKGSDWKSQDANFFKVSGDTIGDAASLVSFPFKRYLPDHDCCWLVLLSKDTSTDELGVVLTRRETEDILRVAEKLIAAKLSRACSLMMLSRNTHAIDLR
jgi:hypothetical protein